MNRIPAIVTGIQQSGAILLVDAEYEGQNFSALMIESQQRPDWLIEGKTVDLVFKETEVTLAKQLQGIISMRNQLGCTITAVEKGELLSKITLKFKRVPIVSVITTRAVNTLGLEPGDEVVAMIKANEVSIVKGNKAQV